MNALIETAIKKLQALDTIMEALAPIMEDKFPTVFTDGSAGYSEPYAPQVIRDRSKVLTEMGFVKVSERRFLHDGVLLNTWRKDDCDILVYYWPSMAGSICKLNKIGEETKVIPIYEVTCLEA